MFLLKSLQKPSVPDEGAGFTDTWWTPPPPFSIRHWKIFRTRKNFHIDGISWKNSFQSPDTRLRLNFVISRWFGLLYFMKLWRCCSNSQISDADEKLCVNFSTCSRNYDNLCVVKILSRVKVDYLLLANPTFRDNCTVRDCCYVLLCFLQLLRRTCLLFVQCCSAAWPYRTWGALTSLNWAYNHAAILREYSIFYTNSESKCGNLKILWRQSYSHFADLALHI